jgi:hypothetical protein
MKSTSSNMIRYQSKSGKASGVTAYRIESRAILIRFRDGALYKYSYASCGETVVETMKKYAQASIGLSTFISQHQPPYEWQR